jgi:hypothetical protein
LSDQETARARYTRALEIYQGIGEFYSIGWAHRALARLESSGPACDHHMQAARQAWTEIGRYDLIEQELS